MRRVHVAPLGSAACRLLCMSFAPFSAAARNGFAGWLATLAVAATPTSAEGVPPLLLPLVTAIALATMVEGESAAPPAAIILSAPPRTRSTFLPSRLHVPDVYAEPYSFNTPRWAAPVDTDRVVWFEFLGRPRRGWTAALAYDEEQRGPIPGHSDLFSVTAEYRF